MYLLNILRAMNVMMSNEWHDQIINSFDFNTTSLQENTPSNHVVDSYQLPIIEDSSLYVLNTNSANTKGYIEICSYEALSNKIYLDSGGVRTIGIGMTTSEIADLYHWPWDREISTYDCVKLFVKACQKYEAAINNALKVNVTQNQFNALLSITYNIGIGGMKGSTFMKRINNGDTPQRVVEAMSWWDTDNGKVIKGLQNRRKAEGLIYLNGNYQSTGKIAYITPNPITHKPKYNYTGLDITPYFNQLENEI